MKISDSNFLEYLGAEEHNLLLAEKKRLEELVQDAGHRIEAWVNYADKALDFAETAKKRFETGDLETKHDILQGLGDRFIFKDKTLHVDLKRRLN